MKLTFLYPLLGLAAGIFLGSEIFPGMIFPAVCLAIGLFFWLFLHILSRKPLTAWKTAGYHPLWIFFLFASVGAWDFEYHSRPYLSKEIDGTVVTVKGKVSEVSRLAEGDRYKIEVDRITDSRGKEIDCRNIGLLLKTDGFSAHPGEMVYFKAKPNKFKENTKRNLKYARSMKRQGIYYTVYKPSSEIIKKGHHNGIKEASYSLRQNIIILLEKSSLSRPASRFLISLLLGDRSYLPSETKSNLSAAGLSHILAVSGLHVGIIFSFFLLIFFPLNFFGKAKWGKIIAIIMVWGYVFLTGFALSTVRAALMATFILWAFLLQRKRSSLNALLAAAFLILLLDPSALWDIGFQLSFMAVLSIILFIDKLNPIDRHTHHFLHQICSGFLITIISTLCTWVLVALYFKNIPVLFLPSNILLLPLLPLFMGASILYVVSLLLGLDLHLLGNFIDLFHDFFISSAGFLSGERKASLNLNIEESTVIFWICGIILAALALHSLKPRQKRVFYSASLLMFVASIGIIVFKEEERFDMTLRFKHDFAFMMAQLNSEDEIQDLKFPNGKISTSKIENAEIWAVDCVLKESQVENDKEVDISKKKFLIVGPRSDLNQVALLIENMEFERVILHANIGHNQMEELLEMLNEKNKEKIHSLRLKGSLEVSL